MDLRVRGKERDRWREEWIPYITSTCSSRYRNQFAACYRFATTRIFFPSRSSKLFKRFHLSIDPAAQRVSSWTNFKSIVLLEKPKEEPNTCVIIARRKPLTAGLMPGLGAKKRRRAGPRTTEALQFRGIGVMKAIIQRARERWSVPTV